MEIDGHIETFKSMRGCLQGEVLPPLFWTLIMDDLLNQLENQSFADQAYSDNLVVIIRIGRIISELMELSDISHLPMRRIEINLSEEAKYLG